MEKAPELLPKGRAAGGARSPAGGAATNGGRAASEPDSGGSDDEHDAGMRVGAEFQARVPDFDPGATKYTDKDNGGMLVWSPYHTVPDARRPGRLKTLGSDGIVAWTPSRGGSYYVDACTGFPHVWRRTDMPSSFREPSLSTISKRRGQRTDFGSHRSGRLSPPSLDGDLPHRRPCASCLLVGL